MMMMIIKAETWLFENPFLDELYMWHGVCSVVPMGTKYASYLLRTYIVV